METEPLYHQISYQQVTQCVERFYDAVQQDELLAGYFCHIDSWPEHQEHISDFWWGLMGGEVGKPRPHAMDRGHRELSFGEPELERWLALFARTLERQLTQEQADRWFALARQLGDKMAERGLLGE